MAEDEVAAQIDGHMWQRLAAENVTDVVMCALCSSLVYNKATSRDHHTAWHERLEPGSTKP